MNSEIKFKQLEHENSDAVVSFNNGTTFRVNRLMVRINEFFINSVLNGLSEKLKQVGLGSTPSYKNHLWNNHGVEAEILEPESGEWKKGKVRMRVILEFCPNEPEKVNNNINQNENSLDDIRRSIS